MTSRGRPTVGAGLTAAISATALAAIAAVYADGTIVFPLTIRNVWYRTAAHSGFTGAKHSGDLTIGRQALEFYAKRRSLAIPLEQLWMISYGTMRGDVDTEWAVLTLKDGNERSFVGLRDGSKWGYGQRTREIYETLIDAAVELSAAQFAAPPGFRPYTELDHIFAMPVPQGWSSYHHELVHVDGAVRWGVVIFSEQELIEEGAPATVSPTSRTTERQRALRELQQGRATAWILRRDESTGGMSCDGFSERALQTVRQRLADDPFFGVPFEIAADQRFDDGPSIDGCASPRLVLEAQAADGRRLVLDLRVVSRRETYGLIGLRTTADAYTRELALFEQGVAGFRFAVTRD
ncbi:MAG TPA: hypothetical protein VD788_11745 [Candidatus Polarisedimenticolaceae bacterium]|nr:hypothetical protein [Candidatus Polarisedimenticolaceae bacterium]